MSAAVTVTTHLVRVGVLGGVGEGLGDDEVRGGLRGRARAAQRRRVGDVDADRDRAAGGQRGQRGVEAAVGEDGRVDAADQVAQLGERLLDLAVRVLQGGGGLRVARRLAPGGAQLDAEGHQPLLGAVVQVALDAAALLVGGTDGGRAGLASAARPGPRPARPAPAPAVRPRRPRRAATPRAASAPLRTIASDPAWTTRAPSQASSERRGDHERPAGPAGGSGRWPSATTG